MRLWEELDRRDEAIRQAMDSVERAEKRAGKDPLRPVFHFRAPANWMNDPNGPLLVERKYHLFYQHNPFEDKWGRIHWGHAVSRDLITWKHLPIALWPSAERGEEHCFSGTATLDENGDPLLFYTSIGHATPECWAANAEEDDLIAWRKWPENPILTPASGGETLYEWRDPYVFRNGDTVFMVHGGNRNNSQGGEAVVTLYRARNAELTAWDYVGILFQHPDPTVTNIECPNFFPLGEKWVLITSPHRQSDWFVGTFDAEAGTFTPEQQGVMDYSLDFYAPNGLEDRQSRRIIWGWVRNFPEGKGWNGCLSLPRVLTLDAHGRLCQQPLPELNKLRTGRFRIQNIPLRNTGYLVPGREGDTLEIQAEIRLDTAKTVGLKLRRSDSGRRAVVLRYDGVTLEANGVQAPLVLPEDKTLRLRVFLDKSVLEVFADEGHVCLTSVLASDPKDTAIEVFAEGGNAALISLSIWQMGSIW